MADFIRLSKRAELRLDALAARTGRTKTFLVRELTRKMLRQLEDRHLAATAGERHEGTEEAGPYEKLLQLRGELRFSRTASQLRGDGFNSETKNTDDKNR
jgi:RHH-type transcriptional regulator, rel operon repressor / antitoxin RelB